MFEVLVWAAFLIAIITMLAVYDTTRDVFHPLLVLSPMFLFLYGWMPLRLQSSGGLDGYFQEHQLVWVQFAYVAGMSAFIAGALSAGLRVAKPVGSQNQIGPASARVLLSGGLIVGSLGLACWLMSIINVGGVVQAFSRPYSGGWDDNGYIRDGSMLMFPAALLILASGLCTRLRPIHLFGAAAFIGPWLLQAVMTARRGPTFMICTVAGMGWFLYQRKRPPLLATAALGLFMGYAILFMVANRQKLYIGSDFEFTTDVTSFAEGSNNGNEYIYGTGAVLAAEYTDRFFWGKRYLAQVLVRPIPSAIWPTKYVDFGVPELMANAGTGEGIREALGWEGADGSAPGIVSDLWLEFRWLSIPVLWILGRGAARAWQRAIQRERAWNAQYIVLVSLSMYFVMQTMEAVIFRSVILSLPIWIVWRKAERAENLASRRTIRFPQLVTSGAYAGRRW